MPSITLSNAPAKQYGIIGYPLGHTMSPALHNWALARAGLAGEYQAFPTAPDKLADFMFQVRNVPIVGLSVTIPHKETVQQHLDGLSERAKAVGATNTLYWDKDRLLGENTDVYGFMAPLGELAKRPGSALVLGAGGASRAVIAGLLELGVSEIAVTNRNADRATTIAREFGVASLPWEDRARARAELLVNTTPLGMLGERQGLSPWPDDAPLASSQIAYDLVYNPVQTRFLSQAQDCGCQTIDGLSMFVHQAHEQFRLWTGTTFDLPGARSLVLDLLQ